MYIVPWGLRYLLNWIRVQYKNPPLYITENGVSDSSGSLDDTCRVEYYRDYIDEVLKGKCAFLLESTKKKTSKLTKLKLRKVMYAEVAAFCRCMRLFCIG